MGTNGFHVPRATFSNSTNLSRSRRHRKFKKPNEQLTYADIASREHVFRIELAEFVHKNGLQIELVENRPEQLNQEASEPLLQVFAKISYQTANGDGLALVSKADYLGDGNTNEYTVIKIPKTLVGDRVQVKIHRHFRYFAEAEVIDIDDAKGPLRNNDLIVCSHFANCSGCQFQMVSYEEQLALKAKTIQKAFKFFYPDLLQTENFGSVIPSPLQYAYRSKITPHYSFKRDNFAYHTVPNIGFKNAYKDKEIIDIKECPIVSSTVEKALPGLIESTQKSIVENYKLSTKQRASTLFLRESLRVNSQTGETSTVCLTDSKKVCTEKIGDNMFQFPANEFFQVNREVLPDLLDFVRYSMRDKNVKNIIDAYCGSGFFGISLANEVKDGKIIGIEISGQAIKYATHNAKLNGLEVPDRILFLEGTSNAIFKHDDFTQAEIDSRETLVIIDPSRKGSDESFLEQLHEFEPKLIIYVSCNVFSQARDLQKFMSILGSKYAVRDVIGFDFFPQTRHVESVAVLERVY